MRKKASEKKERGGKRRKISSFWSGSPYSMVGSLRLFPPQCPPAQERAEAPARTRRRGGREERVEGGEGRGRGGGRKLARLIGERGETGCMEELDMRASSSLSLTPSLSPSLSLSHTHFLHRQSADRSACVPLNAHYLEADAPSLYQPDDTERHVTISLAAQPYLNPSQNERVREESANFKKRGVGG